MVILANPANSGGPERVRGGNNMAEPVESLVPGTVWKLLVKPGDIVKSGDVLFILEVMKTEVPHVAGQDGTVVTVHVVEEDMIEAGTAAVEIE